MPITLAGLLAILIVTHFVDSLNEHKYYEIENSEKKVEYNNPTGVTLPDAESYVIGVKRALLPFRQLSKYLRRPVNDPRTANSYAGVQWKIPPQQISEVVVKSQNQKRWDKSDDASDRDSYCPEIILIRPVNLTQEGGNKIKSMDVEVEDAIKARLRQDVSTKVSDGDEKPPSTKSSPTSSTGPNKKLKIDSQVFQGNGINIKLTFSVDVGNQSKAIENNSTNKSLKKLSTARRRPLHKS